LQMSKVHDKGQYWSVLYQMVTLAKAKAEGFTVDFTASTESTAHIP
jgi:hypothetical protein